jgi:hypothetical protein
VTTARATGADTPAEGETTREEKSTEREWESSPTREDLEPFTRQGVQRLLQQVLEEEVDSVRARA